MNAKICIVIPRQLGAKGGGITRMAGYLNDGITTRGDNVDLSFWPTRMTDAPVLKYLSLAWRLLLFNATIRNNNCDIIHVHVAPRGSTTRKALYARAAARAGKKVILHLHGSGYDEFFNKLSPIRQASVIKFFQKAEAVIVLGQSWRNFAIERLQVPLEKIHIINNGAPDPGLIALRKNPVCQFVFVGTVGERKGVDVLLEACAQISRRRRWKLVICGGGEVTKFRALASRLGLSDDCVSFTGWQDMESVRRQMQDADVFILPSRAENQPIAILEAMAMSLPVISTAIGDIPNQVIDGQTGLVIEADDVAALKEAMLRFIDDRTLCISMGDAGRLRYCNKFTLEANSAKIAKLYETVLMP